MENGKYSKLEERMEELALRIEEQKEKAHTYLGEEIFNYLKFLMRMTPKRRERSS